MKAAPSIAGIYVTKPAMISIVPNPFHEYLKIIFLQKPEAGISIRMTDILGRKVMNQVIEYPHLQENITLSMAGLKKGLFLMEIRDKEGKMLISKKLIKD